MSAILFYIFAAIVIIASLVMITQRSPLPAAFALVISFCALAVLYGLLSAPLLAILQVLVYAGAIMALVVFVIMLLNVRPEDLPTEPYMIGSVGATLVGMGLFFVAPVVIAIRRLPTSGIGPDVPASFGTIEAVGKHLFFSFGFPFELISLLLTVAVVGVVVLAKRRI